MYTWDVDNEMQKLGQNLKRVRSKKGISQGDIARTLKVHKSYISNLENGKSNPTLKTIAKLAKAVSVTTDELLR